MVHLHLGLCPCKEIRMNRQGLFSNISLIYVRLPEQWKSVMYMPVCSEIEALVCSFGDHFFLSGLFLTALVRSDQQDLSGES